MQTGEASNPARGQENLLRRDLEDKNKSGNELTFHHLSWTGYLANSLFLVKMDINNIYLQHHYEEH